MLVEKADDADPGRPLPLPPPPPPPVSLPETGVSVLRDVAVVTPPSPLLFPLPRLPPPPVSTAAAVAATAAAVGARGPDDTPLFIPI